MERTHITDKQVAALAEAKISPAVSLYVPTARKGPEVMQGHIKLKNLLGDAERSLIERGMRPTLARDLLAPASALVEDTTFWDERLDGVAVFAGEGFFRAYHLPFTVPEVGVVSSSFHVRPLVRALKDCPLYFVLALDKSHVRMVRCTPGAVEEVSVPDMPENMEAYLSLDYSEKQLQMHSAGPAGRAGAVINHGAGDRGAEEKDRLARFCHAVDHAVCAYLAASNAPLVLIAVDDVADTYRNLTKCGNLLDREVHRAPKMLKQQEVAELTKPIIDEYADRPRKKSIADYRRMAGTGLTSQQSQEIVPSAYHGRVDVLFVHPEVRLWGKFEVDSDTLLVHESPRVGDEDLVNRATIDVLANSGAVYEISPNELDVPWPMAAIYRY